MEKTHIVIYPAEDESQGYVAYHVELDLIGVGADGTGGKHHDAERGMRKDRK